MRNEIDDDRSRDNRARRITSYSDRILSAAQCDIIIFCNLS